MLSDNFYGMCPGKIPSGEMFTDYRSPDIREHHSIYINNISGDNHAYRHFLQKNSVQIMKNEIDAVIEKGKCHLDNCGLDFSRGILYDKQDPNNFNSKKLSCARTILGYGFPIVHNYPTRMDPRKFEEERTKYNKFVKKYNQ